MSSFTWIELKLDFVGENNDMPFFLYSRERSGEHLRFTKPKGVSLFGVHNGYVPKLLRSLIPAGQEEPYPWHIPVRQTLTKIGHPDSSLVIDVKPRNKEPVFNLFELLEVWGYSDYGWTPAMVLLREVLSVPDTKEVKRENYEFTMDQERYKTPVYSFWYFFEGHVSKGALKGKWNPPGRSSTNSVLLWPTALQYFISHIHYTSEYPFEG
jgi:hypothetical protein